ncbi:hypothetical protein AKJ09_06327 [Labilithrix luteola]|uniref:Uncharacterized protein n=2 Tax=Labilithrix luteola TaxID=1391654 RepID=A0A0K1Q1K8_9BACT|nr:hypothetical protein AKJ09_06327 [Labilithrix luteola]
MRAVALAMLATATTVSCPVLADTKEPESVRLVFETESPSAGRGTQACPSQAEFFAAVRTYTSRWSANVDEGRAEKTIRVRLSVRGRETVGTLVVADATGTLSERTLVGPTCTGVARAMAIMVGVAIEPPGDQPSGPAPSPDEPSPSPSTRTVPPKGTTEPPSPPDAAAPDPPRSADRAVELDVRFDALAFDVRFESSTAVIGGALPGVAASVNLLFAVADGPRWLRGLRPSIGFGVRQSFPKERALRGGSVDFLWTAGNVRACPHTFDVAGIVHLTPCVETNIGILGASAEGYADAQHTSVAWLDVGGSMSVAVSLSQRVFLSSTVLVTGPLLRRPFVLASGATAAEVPSVGVLGGLGIGVRL